MALELQHQDLEARLLTTAEHVVGAPRRVGQPVAGERVHRRLHATATDPIEDHLEHDAAEQVVTGLKLGEEAGRDPRPDHQLAAVGLARPG